MPATRPEKGSGAPKLVAGGGDNADCSKQGSFALKPLKRLAASSALPSPPKRSARLAHRASLVERDGRPGSPASSDLGSTKAIQNCISNGSTTTETAGTPERIGTEITCCGRESVAIRSTRGTDNLPQFLSPMSTEGESTPSATTSVDSSVSCAPGNRRDCFPAPYRSQQPKKARSPRPPVAGPTFLVADIVWAYVPGHPWWPGMVSYEPVSGHFMNAIGPHKHIGKWHVQFFGNIAQRSWVSGHCLVPFENAEQFSTLPKRKPSTSVVSARDLASWSSAVESAALALTMNKQQRQQSFTFQYTQSPAERKPEPPASPGKRPRGQSDTSALESIAPPAKRSKTKPSALSLQTVEKKCADGSKSRCEPLNLETPPLSETSSVDLDTKSTNTSTDTVSGRKAGHRRQPPDIVCCVCNQEGGESDSVVCSSCSDAFHVGCLGVSQVPSDFVCDECTLGVRSCFVCKLRSGDLVACTHSSCKKSYHLNCVKDFPGTRRNHQGIVCPLHLCETCAYRNNSMRGLARVVRCASCPAVFHNADSCLPAGFRHGTGRRIICPRHVDFHQTHPNMTWCFDCGDGGHLICCDRCPNAFHYQCLPADDPERRLRSLPVEEFGGLASPPDSAGYSSPVEGPIASTKHTTTDSNKEAASQWLCSDCRNGKWLHNGDLVWCKLGNYR